jgi:hypothetical protein
VFVYVVLSCLLFALRKIKSSLRVVCFFFQEAPFVSHRSLSGRRKSIHPGADVPDITMAVNYARLGEPIKEVEVLFMYLTICLFVYSLPF